MKLDIRSLLRLAPPLRPPPPPPPPLHPHCLSSTGGLFFHFCCTLQSSRLAAPIGVTVAQKMWIHVVRDVEAVKAHVDISNGRIL